MVHHISLEGGYNIRDLGDLPTSDDRLTRAFVLVRAGNLDKLSLPAQQELIDYGVKTIIDVRDEWEAQNFPNPFSQSTTMRYLNLPLIGDDFSNNPNWKTETQSYATLCELYTKYLHHCKRQIACIVSAIAENPFGTLVHCHAGKDRTGIVSALVLGAVNVCDTAIAEDYALSFSRITPLITEWREYAIQHGRDMQDFDRDVSSHPETMLCMLAYLTAHYGSPTNYLLDCGVFENQIGHLRNHFVSK